jgi:hypothetical protein
MNNIPTALTVRITGNWSRVFVARKACWPEDNTWISKPLRRTATEGRYKLQSCAGNKAPRTKHNRSQEQ